MTTITSLADPRTRFAVPGMARRLLYAIDNHGPLPARLLAQSQGISESLCQAILSQGRQGHLLTQDQRGRYRITRRGVSLLESPPLQLTPTED